MLFTKGDIFSAHAEALVNPVNCVGVMGAGLAHEFKLRFPSNFMTYVEACHTHWLRPGRIFVHALEKSASANKYGWRFIMNFPTKRHWGCPTNIADIESGLCALRDEIEQRKIKSVAIPALGCGLGGLFWEDVRPLIEEAFTGCGFVDVTVFAPG